MLRLPSLVSRKSIAELYWLESSVKWVAIEFGFQNARKPIDGKEHPIVADLVKWSSGSSPMLRLSHPELHVMGSCNFCCFSLFSAMNLPCLNCWQLAAEASSLRNGCYGTVQYCRSDSV